MTISKSLEHLLIGGLTVLTVGCQSIQENLGNNTKINIKTIENIQPTPQTPSSAYQGEFVQVLSDLWITHPDNKLFEVQAQPGSIAIRSKPKADLQWMMQLKGLNNIKIPTENGFSHIGKVESAQSTTITTQDNTLRLDIVVSKPRKLIRKETVLFELEHESNFKNIVVDKKGILFSNNNDPNTIRLKASFSSDGETWNDETIRMSVNKEKIAFISTNEIASASSLNIALFFSEVFGRAIHSKNSLISAPDWIAENFGDNSPGPQHLFVSTAGDVNGDGYSDVIVGVPSFELNGRYGRIYAYYGSPSGLSSFPNWIRGPVPFGSGFGASISPAGDFNGDGYQDILVGASNYYYSSLVPGSYIDSRGAAYMYMGSATGLAVNREGIESTGMNVFFPHLTMGLFGHLVTYLGDVNRDGFDDIAIGAPRFDADAVLEYKGSAFVWYGSSGGLSSTCKSTRCADWTVSGHEQGGRLGFSVSSAGDFNNDGFNDILIGAPSTSFNFENIYNAAPTRKGQAYIWYGSENGLHDSSSPDWTLGNNEVGKLYGGSTSLAGDPIGIAENAVLITAQSYWTSGGRQPTDEPGKVLLIRKLGETPINTIIGNVDQRILAAKTVGDMNGDGVADYGVATTGVAGGLRIYMPQFPSERVVELNVPSSSSRLIQDFSSAGDVNGDGYGDVIATDYQRVYVYYGAPDPVSDTPLLDSRRTNPSNPGDRFGTSLVSGDFNGDGFQDIATGMPNKHMVYVNNGAIQINYGPFTRTYSFSASGAKIITGPNRANNQFFAASIDALDFNGDGIDDIAIGAPGYSRVRNNEDHGGAVFVYLGTRNGVESQPHYQFFSDQAGSQLGTSVAYAGDVNEDGLADFAVGAPGYDGAYVDEGRVFIVLGTRTKAEADVSDAIWYASGGQTGAQFGTSISADRDVNGDQHADILVGAPYYDSSIADAGAIFVWYGDYPGVAQGNGLSGFGPLGIPANANWQHTGDQSGSEFGRTVKAIGDLNGDGSSEIAVGAPLYDWTSANEGALFLWQGLGQELTPSPYKVIRGEQFEAKLGSGISSAGDINGDGLIDLLVSAPFFDIGATGNEGMTYLFLGARDQIIVGNTLADAFWSYTENGTQQLGGALLGNVDLDANGQPDLVVGIPGDADARGAILVFASKNAQITRPINQTYVDQDSRIPRLGRSDSEAGFRLKGIARSAAGRTPITLQGQVLPHNEINWSAGTTAQTATYDTGPREGLESAITLFLRFTDLQKGNAYKWRARYITPNPYFPTTPWVSSPNSGLTEVDLLTGGTNNSLPIASYTATVVSGSAPLFVVFDASSSSDSDGEIVNYTWNFGDGTVGYGEQTQHTYTYTGSFTVELIVTDNRGETARSATQTIVVPSINKAPVPAIVVTPSQRRTFHFNGAASQDDSKITQFHWDFGDRSSASGPRVSHTYSANGSYVITLMVVDDTGFSSQRRQFIHVGNPPTANITISAHEFDTNAPDQKGETINGAYIFLNDQLFGTTDDQGTLIENVPMGELNIRAMRPGVESGDTHVNIDSSDTRQVSIALGSNYMTTTPSNLQPLPGSYYSPNDSMDSFSLAMTVDGQPITIKNLVSVEIDNTEFRRDNVFTQNLRDSFSFVPSEGHIIASDMLSVMRTMSETVSAFDLNVRAIDPDGFAYFAKSRIVYGQHIVTGQIQENPVDPIMPKSGHRIKATLIDTGEIYTTTTQSDGTFEFSDLPSGIFNFTAEVEHNNTYFYLDSIVFITEDKRYRVMLLTDSQLVAGEKQLIEQ